MEVKLDASDLALLRDFLSVAHAQGVRSLLIGAGARLVSLERRWGISGGRATTDWDFAVRVETWDELARLRESLARGPGAHFRTSSAAHRMIHESGRQLDIVPFGGIESPPGVILWPNERRMSVRGLVESDPLAEAIEVGPGLQVDVASVPSWALLKLDAYCDRRRLGETKDIQDFAWLLANYEQAGNSMRVFEELSEALREELIDAEDAGAMLLGMDVARLHTRATIGPIVDVLAECADPYSRLVSDVRAAKRNDDLERDGRLRARICKQLRAFQMGLGSDPHRSGV